MNKNKNTIKNGKCYDIRLRDFEETVEVPPEPPETEPTEETVKNYILNTNTHKFHKPSCSSVDDMKEKNKKEYQGNREDLIQQGYDPCKRCEP